MQRTSIWRNFYKWLAVGLILYALIYGMTLTMPYDARWGQSARVIFYHVPMWIAELLMMGISVFYSIRLLRSMDPDLTSSVSPLEYDVKARESAAIGVIFNILGLLTGIVWSRVTWQENIPGTDFAAWWGWDPIQTCAMIALFIYLAYFLLRASLTEVELRAKVSAVYNIFAATTLIPLFFIIPKMYSDLHPTGQQKGSSIIAGEGLTNEMRLILYPSMLGFILLGVWIFELRSRLGKVELRHADWLADEDYQTAIEE